MTNDTIEILSPRGEQENHDIAIRISANDLSFGLIRRNPHISKVVTACLDAGCEMAVAGDWLVFGTTVKANQEIVLRTMGILSRYLLVERPAEDYLFPRSSVKPYEPIVDDPSRSPYFGGAELYTDTPTPVQAAGPSGHLEQSSKNPTVILFSMFLDKVVSGAKRHTIREWKDANPGDRLELRQVETWPREGQLLAAATCTHVDLIDIDPQLRFVKINGQHLTSGEIEALALADGFDDSEAFWEFFKHPLENGFLIHWEPVNTDILN